MLNRSRIYRATLDTNVFLRSLLSLSGINARAVDLWKDESFILVLSDEIIDEITDVLFRPNLMNLGAYTSSDVQTLIERIYEDAIIVESRNDFQLCRDPNDDKFINCAIVGRVHYLTSGDKDFLEDETLKKALYEYGITVLSASDFVAQIEKSIILENDEK